MACWWEKCTLESIASRSTQEEEHPRRGLTFLLSGLDDEEQIHVRALVLRALCCVEINQCRVHAAALAPSSGEEPASPRHRAGVASMA